MIDNRNWIYSTSMRELLDNRDGVYLKHDERTDRLQDSTLVYCYANTIVLDTKSAEYNTNGITYRQFILLQDFYTIAKDRDIEFRDAVEYSLLYGDVHIRCTCPAWLYWSYAYQGTQLKYLYGLPKENRAPQRNNVGLHGTICKHADKAIRFCLDNIDSIAHAFALYYDRIPDSHAINAVNADGKELTIGVKNGEGDVFFTGDDMDTADEQSVEDSEEQVQEDTEEGTTDVDD